MIESQSDKDLSDEELEMYAKRLEIAVKIHLRDMYDYIISDIGREMDTLKRDLTKEIDEIVGGE